MKDAISFDMGGTTAKVGLILDGEARTLSEFEVGAAQGSGTALATASGYPILGSIVDLVEVGAGGGSVAWIDSGGLAAHRATERRGGTRPGQLRSRRHRADRDRRQRRPVTDRPRELH